MKKSSQPDELREEYDFSSMRGGVRGKHAAKYHAGTNLVRLDTDVAKAFATDEAVNEALRKLLKDSEPARAK